MHKTMTVAGIFLSLFVTAVICPATAFELTPYKDRLFDYPATLLEADKGDYRIVDYQELRDINQRDSVPERRVKRQYVNLSARRATEKQKMQTSVGDLTYYFAGKQKAARIITLYVHGKGGNGKQGINDYSFGGNFNRIKMLMLKNEGLYLSPDAGDFSKSDVTKITALLKKKLKQSPNAQLIIACGSSGGEICYNLANQTWLTKHMGGFILLGSYWNSSFGKASIPIYIAHGSRDTVFAIEKMEVFYQGLREKGIPVKMVRFENGTHGTPIRMIDWRNAINWLLKN